MGASGDATAMPPRGGFLPITRQEVLAEIARELSMRERVYPGQYAKRKLDRQTGERRVALLMAAREMIEAGAAEPQSTPQTSPQSAPSDLARVIEGVAAGLAPGGLRLDELGAETPQGWRLRAIIAASGSVEERIAATIQKFRGAWALAKEAAARIAGDDDLIDG